MPSKTSAPAYMRVAEGMYGEMLGRMKRSEIVAETEKWEDDELYIIAHLLFLNLQGLEALRLQGGVIIEQLAGLSGVLADLAEELEDDEDFDAFEEDLTGEVVFEESDEGSPFVPASSVFDHPIPPATADREEE